jgi:hypothetical protein
MPIQSASQSTFENLLTSEDLRQIRVPVYQRPFSWKREDFDTLWNDIHALGQAVDESHFMGLVVLVQDPDPRTKQFDVVDGQQRLTTVLLLLTVIRDTLYDLLKVEKSVAFNTQVITEVAMLNRILYDEWRTVDGDTGRVPKLQLNDRQEQIFSTLIEWHYNPSAETEPKWYDQQQDQGTSTPHSKIDYIRANNDMRGVRSASVYVAYLFFSDVICGELEQLITIQQKLQYLRSLSSIVRQRLKVIVYNAGTDSDAFKLFECMNDRGLDLAASDLIKNKILMKAPAGTRDEIADLWLQSFVDVQPSMRLDVGLFLRYHANSCIEFTTKQGLYDRYNEVLSEMTSHRIQSFVKELSESMSLFRIAWPLDPNEPRSGTTSREYLLGLKSIGSRQHYPIIIALQRLALKYNRISATTYFDSHAEVVLQHVYSLMLRLVLIDRRFNLVEHLLPAIALAISNETQSDSFQMIEAMIPGDYVSICSYSAACLKQLMERYVSDDDMGFSNEDVLETRLNREYENNGLAKALLRMAYCRNRQVDGGMLHDDVTLEHIMPVKYAPTWGDRDDANEIIYRIGNMTLLTDAVNKRVSNASLESKKQRYGRIADPCPDILSIGVVETSNDWNTEFVAQRSKHVLEVVRSVLAVD